jgi:hypothetical protein
MLKTEHYETGYNDGENGKSIDFEFEGKVLSIFLKIDLLIYKEDSVISQPVSRELIKSIELN